jgi:hypothetical protein
MSERRLAECRSYGELISAINTWILENGIAGEPLDELAGLPQKYSRKLLSPAPAKGLGPKSMGPLLGALGLKIIVAVDQEQFDRIKHRWNKRSKYTPKDFGKRNAVVHFSLSRRFMQANGRKGGPRSRSKMSREEASALGRKAAKARWHKPKVTELHA